MEAWQATLIALLVPASGGGVWAFLRWVVQGRENRENAQRSHELALATRFEAMQVQFLTALREMQEEASEQVERHRSEHLADVKLSAQRMSEAIQAVQQMQARSSQRPSSS